MEMNQIEIILKNQFRLDVWFETILGNSFYCHKSSNTEKLRLD